MSKHSTTHRTLSRRLAALLAAMACSPPWPCPYTPRWIFCPMHMTK